MEYKEIEPITSIASQIFDDDMLADMRQWYLESVSGEWQYVVYIVRRSYIIAQTMEKITGRYMNEVTGTEYLTDASMFLCCDKFAEYYLTNGRFPKILLCDDLFIHGRNVNHILEGVEDRLTALLPELDEDFLKMELSKAISVHVLVRTDAGSYLINRYNANFAYTRYEKAERWHKFSSDLSALISKGDIANAAYVYSQHLEKDIVEEKILSSHDFVETYYQGRKEYIKVYLSQNVIKCVPSIRLLSNEETGGYRAVPFIFLANLDADTTERLYFVVKKKIVEKYNDYQKYISYIDFLFDMDGKRSFNEFLTFALSNTLLKELYEDYNICEDFNDDKVSYEIDKLARNYCHGDMDEVKSIIRSFVKNPIFDSVIELTECFEEIVPDRYVFIDKYHFSSNVGKEDIKLSLENKFYRSGWKEEREAYQFFENPYYSEKNRFERKTEECAKVIKDMIDNLRLGYDDIQKFFAYFMQMMDAGVLAISSNAGKNCDVHGLSQFVKTGEQALLIMILRYYKYIPMLAEVDDFCTLYRVDKEDVLDQIIKKNPESFKKSDKRKITSSELTALLNVLSNIGQRPKDWLSNYASRLDIYDSDDVMEQIAALWDYLDERNAIKDKAKKVLSTMEI